MSTSMFSVGLDVHKDSVTIAVFRNRDPEPLRVDRLPYDHKKIRRYFERLSAKGSVRAWYGASGAGYVLQRTPDDHVVGGGTTLGKRLGVVREPCPTE